MNYSFNMPSGTALYLLSMTNSYIDADIYWIGVCRVYGGNVLSVKKIIANSYMDTYTITFDGLTISVSGGDGCKTKGVYAIRLQ